MHVQKEAGILERGMQVLKQAINSLLGQREEDKSEHQVAALPLALHLSIEHSPDGNVETSGPVSAAKLSAAPAVAARAFVLKGYQYCHHHRILPSSQLSHPLRWY